MNFQCQQLQLESKTTITSLCIENQCQKILSFPSPLDVLTSQIQNTLTYQIFFLFLNWDIIDTELYLGFRCTTCWSNICKYCEIITIISLHILKIFFIMTSTFKSCFLRKFQICSAALLNVVSVLSVTPPWLIFFIAGGLHCLTPFTRFTQSPHPHRWQPSLFSVSLSFFPRLHVWVGCSFCLSVSDLSHLA